MDLEFLVTTLGAAGVSGMASLGVMVKNGLQRRWQDSAEVERLRDSLAQPAVPDDVAPTLSHDGDTSGHASLLPALAEATDVAQRRATTYLDHHSAALRQQRVAFWSSLVVGTLGLVLIVVGVGFALFATTDIGILTSVSSLLPGAASALLFSQSKVAGARADENLKRLTSSVDRAEAIQTCIRIAAGVRDETTRDRIVAIASLVAAFPDVPLRELSSIVADAVEAE